MAELPQETVDLLVKRGEYRARLAWNVYCELVAAAQKRHSEMIDRIIAAFHPGMDFANPDVMNKISDLAHELDCRPSFSFEELKK